MYTLPAKRCARSLARLPARLFSNIPAPKSRPIHASDIALTAGYRIEPVAAGLTYPTGVTWDDRGRMYVVKRHPEWHDLPCRDLTLTGENFESDNGHGKVQTGAYVAYGTSTKKGEVISGSVPCSGSVVRISPRGGRMELVGWGFRNPFGLAFTPDGKLLVTDNGYDTRGSRPVWGAADWLWIVDPEQPPTWHGWPERADGRDVTEERYKVFACHSSSNGLDVSRSDKFGYAGQAFVAQFGDQAPATGKLIAPAGFKVVRVDLSNGVIYEFASNRGKDNGPASMFKNGGGFERPIAVRFSPAGDALYVVDFGVMTMEGHKAKPREGTGVLWKITREAR